MSRASEGLKTKGMEDAIAVIYSFIKDDIESAAKVVGGNVEAAKCIVHKAGLTDKILKYKGHIGNVKYSSEDKRYYGSVLGVHAPIAYEGATEELLEDDFRKAVDEYLSFCAAESAPTETRQECVEIMVEIDEALRKRGRLATECFIKETTDSEYGYDTAECIRRYRRLQALYQIPTLTGEVAELLMDVVDAMWECEEKAKRRGIELKPLDPREMEAAFPFRRRMVETYIRDTVFGNVGEEPDCELPKKWRVMEMLCDEPGNGNMSRTDPEVSVISSGEIARAAHGYRYGGELLKFNRAHLDALLRGHQLAVEINQGEYVLFIETEQEGQDKPLWTQVKYWEGRIPPPEYFADPPAYSMPIGPAVNYKDLLDYAKQSGRDATELNREEVEQFVAERRTPKGEENCYE